ncbi:MAG: LytTR family DNA-binding domain-containing protein, partial [Bacteroidetes bacterium]|nr:LytTR family DNA-binding domain-containing protein [Bacteroidota bacterium]
TTAYDQYALKAFDLNVSDYLLKPISFERFIQSIDKLFDLFVQEKPPDTSANQYRRDYFFVKTEYRMQRIDFDDILFVEGMKEYLRIHTKTEKIMILESFKNLEESLPSEQFVRVHKSYLVALNKIDRIEKNRITIGKTLIPISETYRDAFFMLVKRDGV